MVLKHKPLAIMLFAIAGVATPLAGFEFHSVQLTLAETWIGNGYQTTEGGDPVQGSDVSPLRFTIGGATRVGFGKWLQFRPGLAVLWQEYLLTDSGKVVPTQIETGTSVGPLAGTLVTVLRLPWVYEHSFSNELVLGGGAGMSFPFHWPVSPIEGSDVSGLWDYFYGSLRFVSPELQGYLSYPIGEQTSFGVDLHWLLPWHNLWDGFEVPFWDGMQVSLGLSLHYRL